MVRSDYGLAERLGYARPSRLARPLPDISVRRSRRRAANAAGADPAGRRTSGRRTVLRRRRARLGQEPPRARVRVRGGRRLAPSSSSAPATPSSARPTARSSRRSSSSPGRPTPTSCAAAVGTGGGELTRLVPDLAGADRRAAGAGRRPIPTPSATACTPRSPTCWRRSAPSARCVLVVEDGHWADAPTLLLLRHLAPRAGRARGADPDRRHLPRHRGRRPRHAGRDPRRPAALRRRRPHAPRRALGRGDLGVRPPRRRRRARRRPARARAHDRRPDRGQPVPGLRAVAGAGGDRRRRGGRRPARPGALAGRARHPGERARGGQPAALAARAGDQRPARAGGDGGGASSSSRRSAAPTRPARRSCSRRSRRPCAAG